MNSSIRISKADRGDDRVLRPIHHRTDRFSSALSAERGAKMGQTIRQSMPSNAKYAFMQPDACTHYSQQSRAYLPKSLTYPYTIGV
ncbi:hypothetical protein EMIT0357P_10722 [Pseudomonas marginalis]